MLVRGGKLTTREENCMRSLPNDMLETFNTWNMLCATIYCLRTVKKTLTLNLQVGKYWSFHMFKMLWSAQKFGNSHLKGILS